jgi:tRNA (guanine-N7-)-methyltransferase
MEMNNEIKSYAKRLGRFTDAQRRAYQSLACKYLIPFKEEIIDFSKTFGNSNDVIMEIGFGSGIATLEIAVKNPDKNYLGIEVHLPGIGRLFNEIEKNSLYNVKVIEYDAVHVVQKRIPKNSLAGIHIFFPDQRTKKKHRKRRLVQRPFTENLADCLKPDGYLYMVTDWEDYASHALGELTLTKNLKNVYDDFAEPQSWRPKTRFEEKGLKQEHVIRELMFVKKRSA